MFTKNPRYMKYRRYKKKKFKYYVGLILTNVDQSIYEKLALLKLEILL